MQKKIDIFTKSKGILNLWQYNCSTTVAKTCGQAKTRFCKKHSLDKTQVKTSFSE